MEQHHARFDSLPHDVQLNVARRVDCIRAWLGFPKALAMELYANRPAVLEVLVARKGLLTAAIRAAAGGKLDLLQQLRGHEVPPAAPSRPAHWDPAQDRSWRIAGLLEAALRQPCGADALPCTFARPCAVHRAVCSMTDRPEMAPGMLGSDDQLVSALGEMLNSLGNLERVSSVCNDARVMFCGKRLLPRARWLDCARSAVLRVLRLPPFQTLPPVGRNLLAAKTKLVKFALSLCSDMSSVTTDVYATAVRSLNVEAVRVIFEVDEHVSRWTAKRLYEQGATYAAAQEIERKGTAGQGAAAAVFNLISEAAGASEQQRRLWRRAGAAAVRSGAVDRILDP